MTVFSSALFLVLGDYIDFHDIFGDYARIAATGCFAIVVIPLSLVGLKDQFAVQAAMTLVRFLALGLIFSGAITGIVVGGVHPSVTVAANNGKMSLLFDASGFGLLFSTAVFSQLFQHSVPGLVRPLPERSRGRPVMRTFAAALSTNNTTNAMIIIACCL